jgi:hypothetical protein
MDPAWQHDERYHGQSPSHEQFAGTSGACDEEGPRRRFTGRGGLVDEAKDAPVTVITI